MRKILIIGLVVFFLMGCASQPITTNSAANISDVKSVSFKTEKVEFFPFPSYGFGTTETPLFVDGMLSINIKETVDSAYGLIYIFDEATGKYTLFQNFFCTDDVSNDTPTVSNCKINARIVFQDKQPFNIWLCMGKMVNEFPKSEMYDLPKGECQPYSFEFPKIDLQVTPNPILLEVNSVGQTTFTIKNNSDYAISGLPMLILTDQFGSRVDQRPDGNGGLTDNNYSIGSVSTLQGFEPNGTHIYGIVRDVKADLNNLNLQLKVIIGEEQNPLFEEIVPVRYN